MQANDPGRAAIGEARKISRGDRLVGYVAYGQGIPVVLSPSAGRSVAAAGAGQMGPLRAP